MQAVTPYLSVDFIIFAVFLALNLIIGLRAGMNVKTVRDFAIGKKDFSTAAVTATIVATWFSGAFLFRGLESIYVGGLLYFAPAIGTSLSLLFTGQVLAPRMGEFLNNLSVAEAMGDLYGKAVRFITATSGIVVEVGRIALQFQVIGKMLNLLLDIGAQEATFAAAIIVILYSTFGGIRSVTVTDVFQFIAFAIFIPTLGLVIWYNLKEPHHVMDNLTTNPTFSLQELFRSDARLLNFANMLTIFFIPGLMPSLFQRISIAKNVNQVKTSFTYASIIAILLYASLAFVGILLLSDNATLVPNNLVTYIINHYAYTGLKGIILIGIVALAMSTADSSLNACTVLALNDFSKVLFPKWEDSIGKLRIASALIGLIAFGMTFYTSNILKLLLLTGSFYTPIVSVPLLLSVFGFRSTGKSVLIGMAGGFFTVIAWKILRLDTFIEPLIPGMLANVTFLVGSHYLLQQPGGWVGTKDNSHLLAAKQAKKEFWKDLLRSTKILSLREYLENNAPKMGFIYFLVGLYVLGGTYSLFFTIPKATMMHYVSLYMANVYAVLACSAILMTYPAWPPFFRARAVIPYIWPLLIGYPLFVVSTQLAIMSGFDGLSLTVLLCNFMLVAVFLPRFLAIFMPISGVLLGFLIVYICYGPITYSGVLVSMKFNIAYTIWILSTFLLFIFKANKQKERIEIEKDHLGKAYAGKKKELSQVIRYSQELAKEVEEDKHLLSSPEDALAYLRQAIYHIKDYVQLEVASITVNKLVYDVKRLVQIEDQEINLVTQIQTKQEAISVDVEKVKQLLSNAIVTIHESNKNNEPIRIILEDATLGYTVSYMQDYTKEIGALRMVVSTESTVPSLEPIYHSSPISIDNNVKDENIVENLRIIDAHYGYADLSRPATHIYVIPCKVRDVRAKVMELLREPAQADPEELNHTTAIAVEEKLWHALSSTTVDKQVVEKALDTIKRYHAGVKRKSGEPFFTHPISVALILLDYCKDQDAVIAALLHDTVEDTKLSLASIKATFGEQVAFIVGKVTNLEDRIRRLSLNDHENIERLANYEDKRAMYVKLADRMHNMRTIAGHPSLDKQKEIAKETTAFFVPMAKNLGLPSVAQELNKLSLDVLRKKPIR